MEGAERSNHYFMNVKDIINMAFGEFDGNVVNFRLIRIILYLLARQLRLLERRVEVNVPIGLMESSSSFSVTEVKVHAITKRGSKDSDDISSKSQQTSQDRREYKERKVGTGYSSGKGSRESREDRDTRERRDDKENRERGESGQGRKGKQGREAREGRMGKESRIYKEGTGREEGKDRKEGKEATEREGKRGKGGKDTKTYLTKGKHASSSSKESEDDESSLSDAPKESKYKKEGKDRKTGQRDKEIKSDKGSKSDKESKFDKDSRKGKVSKKQDKEGKDYIDSAHSDEEQEISAEMGAEGKARKERKERKDKKQYAADKISKDRIASTESKESKEGKATKDYKEHQKDQDDQESKESKEGKRGKRGKERKEDKIDGEEVAKLGKEGKISKGRRGKLSGDKRKLADHRDSSDSEKLKEKVLRIIHQRADSYEQPDESPTPMASVEQIVTQYEKILVVESLSSVEKGTRGTRSPRMSVVTQEEFTKLTRIVDDLCARFKVGEYEDSQLMDDLYKRTSYTEAMAALQLSARLEATEKLLGRMVAAIGTIARSTPGIKLDAETKHILETYELSDQRSGKIGHDRKGAQKKASPRKAKGSKSGELQIAAEILSIEPAQSEGSMATAPTISIIKSSVGRKSETEGLKQDCVTYMDLDSELRKLSNEMMKQVTAITTRNVQTADRAFKIASSLENKLDSSLDVAPRMVMLESQVATYADQINALDTGLTSQMINYQEQLTQMQHELEVGLEAMAEALANAQGADTIAVAELNTNFITLQTEQEAMTWQQRDLQQSHDLLASDLASLWKQIELLRDTKSDRDEVTDALRDKAGIKDLNGLVSLEQFDAVRGDLEKRIASAYDKFNNQEIIWQKAIDDMLRELGEKADLIQLHGLKDQITKYLNAMRTRIQFISDIIGEPKAAIVSKKLFRDTICISCASPATMETEEPDIPPALPKFSDKKGDADKVDHKNQIKGDGDHKTCYPGLPIPHPKDPRSHICTRYCGGSHTLIPSGPPRVPPSTIITPLNREVTAEQGADGKMYQVEMTPCLPCNLCDCDQSENNKSDDDDGVTRPSVPSATNTAHSGHDTPTTIAKQL